MIATPTGRTRAAARDNARPCCSCCPPPRPLDYDTPVRAAVLKQATDPLFTDRAAELIAVLRRKTPAEVAELMDLSDTLAALNVARYAAWQPQATPANSKPAVLAFDGDVYDGLDAKTLKAADLAWAQEHLVILSGLYGVLRPLDRLQPYRLEMGTRAGQRRAARTSTPTGATRVAEHLNERLAGDAAPVVVNLASHGILPRVALRKALRARVSSTACSRTGRAAATRSSASSPSGRAG